MSSLKNSSSRLAHRLDLLFPGIRYNYVQNDSHKQRFHYFIFFFSFFFLVLFLQGQLSVVIIASSYFFFFLPLPTWTLFTLHNNYEYLRLCILTKILKLNITHDNTGRQNRSDVTGGTTRISHRAASSWTDAPPSYNAWNIWLFFDDVSPTRSDLSLFFPLSSFFLSFPLEGNKYKNSQCFDLLIRQRI